MDNDINKGNAVTVSNKSLSQLNRTLEITNKLLDGDIEELFNMGFCILNGLKVCDRNYYKLFETDPDFLSKIEFKLSLVIPNRYKFEGDTGIDFEKAHSLFSKALHLDNKHVYSMILRAYSRANLEWAYFSEQDFKTALESIEKNYLYVYPKGEHETLSKLNSQYAFLYYIRGDITSAISHYPNFPSALFLKSHQDDLNGTKENLTKVINLLPNSCMTYYFRGCNYVKLGDLTNAEKDYYRTIELDEKSHWAFKAYNERSLIREKNGDISGAIEDLDKAKQIQPYLYYGTYLYCARLKVKESDYVGALQDYTTSIQILPKCESYYERGEVKEKLGDNKGAIEDFTKAIDCNFKKLIFIHYDYLENIKFIQNAYFKKYKLFETMHYFKESNSEKIQYDNLLKIVKVHSENNLNSTIKCLDNIISDSNVFLYRLRAFFKEKDGDYFGSIQDFDSIINLEPLNFKYYLQRASLKEKIGDYKGAIQDYDSIIAIDTNNFENYRWRASLKEKDGDYDGAIKDFNKLIILSPTVWNHKSRALLKIQNDDIYGAIEDLNICIFNIYDFFKSELNRDIYKLRSSAKQIIKDMDGEEIDLKTDSYILEILNSPDDYTNMTYVDKIIKLNPQTTCWYCYRAVLKEKIGDFIGAILDYDMIINIDPKKYFFYRLRALAKELIGDIKGADIDRNEFKRLLNQKQK